MRRPSVFAENPHRLRDGAQASRTPDLQKRPYISQCAVRRADSVMDGVTTLPPAALLADPYILRVIKALSRLRDINTRRIIAELVEDMAAKER